MTKKVTLASGKTVTLEFSGLAVVPEGTIEEADEGLKWTGALGLGGLTKGELAEVADTLIAWAKALKQS